MARRKYRPSPAISGAGRGVKPDEAAPSEQHPLGSEPTSPSAATAQPRTEYGKPELEPAQHASTLGAQVNAVRAHAEQQQQQQQPQQAFHDPLALYLASIPGLSPHKFYFLHHYFSQHPDRLNNDHWQLLRAAHHIATAERKIPEDGPEYFQTINALLQQHAATPPPHAAPAPPPMPEPQHMAHVDVSTEHSDSGEPESAHMSIFSAPVSRGDHGHSIEPEMSPSTVRLSAEQRDVARRSMPHLSADEAEKNYAANLIKMQKMQKSGLIK